MAEIIEKQELPVTITKVKIGKKDLTKKIIDQIPFGIFVYCEHEDKSREWGLPYIISDDSDELIFDKNKPYIISGTLLGYVKPTWDDKHFLANYRKNFGKFNNKGKWYFIIWYTDDGKLKKGYIDQWTIIQLNLKLEQIFI